MNRSPWLELLNSRESFQTLNEDKLLEVVVIGGGISGIMSCYFTLKNTSKHVILIEGGKIAHGATGHNAGMAVAGFEKPFMEIATEFGLNMAIQASKDLDFGRDLLLKILTNETKNIFYTDTVNNEGFIHEYKLDQQLQECWLFDQAGYKLETIFIRSDYKLKLDLDPKYKKFIKWVKPEFIKQKLNTKSDEFLAYKKSEVILLASAALCEELLVKMLQEFPDRFEIFENTVVEELAFETSKVRVKTFTNYIEADKVILCTNGFEKITFDSKKHKDMTRDIRSRIYGLVSYMSGFTYDKQSKTQKGFTYNINKFHHEPYIYLSNRPFNGNKGGVELVAVGGPEKEMIEANMYQPQDSYPENIKKETAELYNQYYISNPDAKLVDEYKWHGLMGYTKNGIRMIGPDKLEKNLLFNLGCNGLGIIPAVFGGYKIAQFLNNEKLEKSIFDPN